jgi:hypothetical protein
VREVLGKDGPAQECRTDATGRFRLREAGAGRYLFSATAPGLAPYVYASFGRGRAACLERIELAPGGTVLGLVDLSTCFGDASRLRASATDTNGVVRYAAVVANGHYLLYGRRAARVLSPDCGGVARVR